MKLTAWAKQQGICYHTAYRWFKAGKIPAAHQMDTGTIIIEDEKNSNEFFPKEQKVLVYCRVSTPDRKASLELQAERCKMFCAAKGYTIDKIYREVASGMNDNRQQLMRLLDENPTIIVVENKDRLTRFGFNYLEKLLGKLGCKIEVINKTDDDEKDLLKDFVSIITSFCCRIYGLRRGHKKAKKIKETLEVNN